MILKEPSSELQRLNNADRPPPYNTTVVQCTETGSVNEISVVTRKDDITGTYFINPDLPVPDGSTLGKGKCSKRSRKARPAALFRTKSGVIDLNLAILGHPSGTSKATVELNNRKSDIAVNLLTLQPYKHISLEATTRAGNIIVLIPRSFCGALQLRSPKGRVKFLPVLASNMRVVDKNDQEALIFFGDTSPARPGSLPPVADYCKLTSVSGKVIVGLSGEDTYVPEPGFWKRLAGKVTGS